MDKTIEAPSGTVGGALTIVKVGGAVVEDDAQLTQLLSLFTAIPGAKILVHGGGRRATQVAAQLGIETHMVQGRRVTDEDMLRVVTMVYGGLVNKHIVACLQAIGNDAIGLTGADGDIIRSVRRPPVTTPGVSTSGPATTPDVSTSGPVTTPGVSTSGPATIDYGYVGDVTHVRADRLAMLIDNGITPVIAPLTHDGQGSMLNTNADTMASQTAVAMAKAGYQVTLVFAFEKPGVLANPDDDSSVIPTITHSDFLRLKADGTISGGMLPKIENALKAIDAGVQRVVITSAGAIGTSQGTTILDQ